jgi:hypothetical protein
MLPLNPARRAGPARSKQCHLVLVCPLPKAQSPKRSASEASFSHRVKVAAGRLRVHGCIAGTCSGSSAHEPLRNPNGTGIPNALTLALSLGRGSSDRSRRSKQCHLVLVCPLPKAERQRSVLLPPGEGGHRPDEGVHGCIAGTCSRSSAHEPRGGGRGQGRKLVQGLCARKLVLPEFYYGLVLRTGTQEWPNFGCAFGAVTNATCSTNQESICSLALIPNDSLSHENAHWKNSTTGSSAASGAPRTFTVSSHGGLRFTQDLRLCCLNYSRASFSSLPSRRASQLTCPALSRPVN